MSNFKNIKPYSDFAHEASSHGGVDSYLNEIADANFELGVQKEKDSELLKGVILLGGGLIVWEVCKAGIRNIKAYRIKKKAQKIDELERRSDAAKAAIIQAGEQTTLGGTKVAEENSDAGDEEEQA